MNKFLPKISAPIYSLSATAIGFLLIDEFTPAEQNSLGNWFMLIGQVLCTNASQQQVINNYNKTSNQSNQHIINDDPTETINKVIEAMQKEINELKK